MPSSLVDVALSSHVQNHKRNNSGSPETKPIRPYVLKSGQSGLQLSPQTKRSASDLLLTSNKSKRIRLNQDSPDKCRDRESPLLNGQKTIDSSLDPSKLAAFKSGGDYASFMSNPMGDYCMEPFLWQSLQMAKFAASGLLTPGHSQYSSLLSKFPLYSLYDLAAYGNGTTAGGVKPQMPFDSASYMHLLKAYQQQQMGMWPASLNQAVHQALASRGSATASDSTASDSTARCSYCSETGFESTSQLDEHILAHVSKQQVVYACEHCPGTHFDSRPQLDTHLVDRHSLTIHKCVICDLTFPSKQEVDDHVTGQHGKETLCFHCVLCSRSWTEEAELKMHVKLQHSQYQRKPDSPEPLQQHPSPSSSLYQATEVSPKPTNRRVSNFGIDSLIRKDSKDEDSGENNGTASDQTGSGSEEENAVKCNICDKRVSGITQLTEHKVKHHLYCMGLLRCAVCKHSLNSVDEFLEHQSECHAAEDRCILCRHPLDLKADLRSHGEKHFNFQSTATLSPNSSTSAYSSETEETPEAQNGSDKTETERVDSPSSGSPNPTTYCIEEDSATSGSVTSEEEVDDEEEDDEPTSATVEPSFCAQKSVMSENKPVVECFH